MKINNELSNDGTYTHLGMDPSSASHFMKIASELKLGTYPNMGAKALYLIATMPPEERDNPQQLSNGETKKPENMTVRELRETKRRLKDKEQELADSKNENADLQAENDSIYLVVDNS